MWGGGRAGSGPELAVADAVGGEVLDHLGRHALNGRDAAHRLVDYVEQLEALAQAALLRRRHDELPDLRVGAVAAEGGEGAVPDAAVDVGVQLHLWQRPAEGQRLLGTLHDLCRCVESGRRRA